MQWPMGRGDWQVEKERFFFGGFLEKEMASLPMAWVK